MSGVQPHGRLTTSQLMYQTQFTKTGVLDLTNRKPFRKAAAKALARKNAQQDGDGVWRSNVDVSFHPEVRS